MKPAINCPGCDTIISENKDFCKDCGVRRPIAKANDRCSNPQCDLSLEPDAKYCEDCGSPAAQYKDMHDFLSGK